MWGYAIARPDEYLAITGQGVSTVKICKTALLLPLQKCHRFSIQPHDYPMSLQAMTREKLQCMIPVVFTIGPDVNKRGDNGVKHTAEDRGDALLKYAMLLADANQKNGEVSKHVESIVKGIIEGETRVLVSSMTMEEIFTEREEFKKKIFRNIQSELDQFGLKIYNANVKELRDAPDSNYFASLSKKAHEGASNQARIDVAEAQLKGNVGEAERLGKQNREIAKINAETAVQKTERDSEKAQAEALLQQRKTAFNRDVHIAQIEATRATETRDEELKKNVEEKRAQTEMERLRATEVVRATIQREAQQQAADAKAYEQQASADATAYRATKETDIEAYRNSKKTDMTAYTTKISALANYESETKKADAAAYSKRALAEANFVIAEKEAEAQLLRRQKEAEGLTAMAGAYAAMREALGGPEYLNRYLMIERGVYTELATANAEAVRGMAPKMTIWNTGSNAGEKSSEGAGSADAGAAIRNVYQMLPPLMTTIHDQTGITLPEWQYGKLGQQLNKPVANGTNGHLENADRV